MADAAASAYEAQRRRQMEENKRKLEELGLRHLYAALVPPTAKKLKRKARAPTTAAAPIRRSGRVASLPEQPEYREHILAHKKPGVDANAMAKANAMVKAKQLEAKLGLGHPTFVKPMSQASIISNSFYLLLPAHFCRKHMPERDVMISVVDEQDKKFGMKYDGVKYHRFSKCRGFITDHKLVDGDCLLFQLIQPTVFKVYIIRASSCKENGN